MYILYDISFVNMFMKKPIGKMPTNNEVYKSFFSSTNTYTTKPQIYKKVRQEDSLYYIVNVIIIMKEKKTPKQTT